MSRREPLGEQLCFAYLLNEANADWKNGGDLYQSDHTMIREDGLTAKEIDWL